MNIKDKITYVLIAFVIGWCLKKILEFYGIGPEYYGIYLTFGVFMLISSQVLCERRLFLAQME